VEASWALPVASLSCTQLVLLAVLLVRAVLTTSHLPSLACSLLSTGFACGSFGEGSADDQSLSLSGMLSAFNWFCLQFFW